MSQFPPDRVLVEYSPVRHVTFDLKPVIPPANIALVQVIGGNNGSGSDTNFAVTPSSNVGAGDLLIAAVAGLDLNTVSGTQTVTDTLGTTYSPIGTVALSPSSYGIMLWAGVTSGGADVVTWHSGGGAISFVRVIVAEFSGVTTLDQNAQATGSTYPLDSGAMTTTTANELIFGWGVADNNTTVPGAGFTIALTETSQSTEYEIVNATGTYHAIFPGDGANSAWAIKGATFK